MILEIICAIFDISLVFLFFDRILKHRRNINSIFFYGSFILGETFIFLATELFGTDYSEIRIIITFTLNIFILISLSMLYNSSIKKRIFVSFNLQLYSMLSEYIVLIIISSFPSDISESLLSNQVYGAILSKIVTFILCTVTIIFYNKKRSSYNIQYSILILIMPVVSIILLLTIPLRTDLTPLQSELSIIGIGGLLLANIINYYLLDNIIRVQELRRNESNLTNQINLQIEKYHQISEAYRNSRSIVHDVKKQYFYINECISKNDTGRLQEFINRSIIELEASAARVNTGNLVIDSFVSNHMTLAERSGIKFNTSVAFQSSFYLKHHLAASCCVIVIRRSSLRLIPLPCI